MSSTTAAEKWRPLRCDSHEVEAILAGRKTMFRRPIKCGGLWTCDNPDGPAWPFYEDEYGDWQRLKCPFGEVDDRLWVKETWQCPEFEEWRWKPSQIPPGSHVVYETDYLDDSHGTRGEKSADGPYRRWRPSIHMPRWASRITLEITGVGVERIQDISEVSAINEGAFMLPNRPGYDTEPRSPRGKPPIGDSARQRFARLFREMYSPDVWDANPWVWCVSFKRIEEKS